MASLLFSPLTLPAPVGSGVTLRNRTVLSPMCQYAVDAEDGVPTDWYLQHYGALAAGGFGMVVVESTGVNPAARISPRDLGMYTDAQVQAHAGVVSFLHSQGAIAAVQLNHAGGKAGTYPWLPGFTNTTVPGSEGGWQTVGMTDRPVVPGLDAPVPLDQAGFDEIVADFADAARRADRAGYDVIQIHSAHGYLLHQALSPLNNTRTDEYGDAEGRTRLVRDVVAAVRAAWPAHKPLGMRLSVTDWTDGGWDIEASIRLLRDLAGLGLNWVDVSSTGISQDATVPMGPGYHVPLAARLKEALADTGMVVSVVGMISDGPQAETILAAGAADAVTIGRAALRNPHWPAATASELGVERASIPASPHYWRAGW